MVKIVRAFFLSLTILAFLLFSTIGTTPVYADDGSGTEAPAVETSTGSGEEQPTETVTEDTPPPSEEEQPPAETLESILEQAPDNTTVTVLSAEGEALPLASQESADAIAAESDPIWCPAGQVPTPDANDCTQSFPSFDELLTFLQAHEGEEKYQKPGTIYIQQGAYLGGETSIDFNDYAFTQFNNYDLTLQGGWDTSFDPAVTPTPTYTSTEFTVPITIGSSSNLWGGSLTINNISISGVADQTGLTLHAEGDIYLNEVEVTDSHSGADINAGGDVYVDNSKFDNNGAGTTDGYGVKIESGGETSLYFMSASNNASFGADVKAGGPVTLDGSFFNNNVAYTYDCKSPTAIGGYGLKVISQGNITVNATAKPGEGIEANDNYLFGAYLQGANVFVSQSTFNRNGSGDVGNPVGKGLEVVSTGTVTLKSVEASKNQLFGADVKAAGNVTVEKGVFNSNQGYAYVDGWVYEGYGLKVATTSGNILLDTVTANDNYLYGASLQGAQVDVKNSFFSGNDSDWHEHAIGYGLKIDGTGNVTLASVTANDNQRFGADIKTSGAVTVTKSFFNGNQSYTYSYDGAKTYDGYGIKVVTSREVSFVEVTADENYLYGARIEAKDVAIDTASFSNNGSGDALALTGRGLEVVSVNDVALAAVDANNNQQFGADIKAGNLVAIERSNFNGHIAYYYDYFTHEILKRDGGYGLKVVTLGDIAMEVVTANGNYLYGASLQGDDIAVEDSFFTANGSGVISAPPGDPNGYGLKIVGTGEVEVIGVTAENNQFYGADIKAGDDVTILTSFFSGNQSVTFAPCEGLEFFGYGLTVVTTKNIFLNFVTANRNNLWGASLKGDDVTVHNSQFNNNISDSNIFIDDTGLIVDAAGDVDIFKTEAKENRLIGATIKAQGGVFISQSTFTDNRGFTCLYDWCPEGSITYHGHGLDVTTPGLIRISGNTVASGNNLFGAQLNGGLVTVINSTFSDNRMGDGLIVKATDNVTLTNVTASNNGGDGVDVDGVCLKTVQVTGGTFSDNLLFGLRVVDATLTRDNTQVFANNGAGNVFTDTSTCVVVVAPVAPTTLGIQAPTLTTTGAANTTDPATVDQSQAPSGTETASQTASSSTETTVSQVAPSTTTEATVSQPTTSNTETKVSKSAKNASKKAPEKVRTRKFNALKLRRAWK